VRPDVRMQCPERLTDGLGSGVRRRWGGRGVHDCPLCCALPGAAWGGCVDRVRCDRGWATVAQVSGQDPPARTRQSSRTPPPTGRTPPGHPADPWIFEAGQDDHRERRPSRRSAGAISADRPDHAEACRMVGRSRLGDSPWVTQIKPVRGPSSGEPGENDRTRALALLTRQEPAPPVGPAHFCAMLWLPTRVSPVCAAWGCSGRGGLESGAVFTYECFERFWWCAADRFDDVGGHVLFTVFVGFGYMAEVLDQVWGESLDLG
jgi:hypothetical protein